MPTAGDICNRALRKIEVLGEEETASGQMLVDTLAALNSMLDSFSLDRSLIFELQTESFPLVIGTGTYSIGPGGAFNTVRPIDIEQAFIRDAQNLDYELAIWGNYRFNQIVQKSLAGWPRTLRYTPSNPLGSIDLVEVPNLAFTLKLATRRQFTTFASAVTNVILPVGWDRLLVFNLAVEVAPDWNRVPSDVIADIATGSKELVRRANLGEVVAEYDPELSRSRGRGGFSIYRGK